MVCDASEGVTSEDLRVAELAMKTGCATLVALNKWDIGATDLDDATARLERRLRQRPPVMTASAARGRNVPKLARARHRPRGAPRLSGSPPRSSTVSSTTSWPARHRRRRRGRRLRLYYAAQIGRRPPRFAIQVNDRRLINRDWAFHLENRLREAYGLEGVPLIIEYVPRKSRYKDAA